MANDLSRIKIDPTKNALVLQTIRLGDSFGIIYDKINSNFLEIQLNGGGPMGPAGPQGPPGCKGEAGPQGAPGESDLSWRSIQSKRCDTDAYNNENLADAIVNRYSNRGLLLTNLSINDNYDFEAVGTNEAREIAEKVSTVFSDWKVKIYNSINGNEGGHIHLLNTSAIQANAKYLCKSGFTISNDFDTSTINKEILRIKGQKNLTNDPDVIDIIGSHTTEIELTTDLLRLRRGINTQSWEFDTKDDEDNTNKMKFVLDTMTAAKEVNVPDRSGYNAVWEDTLERSDTWEIITGDDIAIYKSRFLDANFGTQNFEAGGDHWVELDPDSFIRFKRQNEWVIVEFHIGINRILSQDNFTLRNIQFIVNKESIGCRTIGWFPSSVMENESLDEISTDMSCYGHFKVESVTFPDASRSFLISNKFPYNIYNVTFDSTASAGANNYWISGQVWATVSDSDSVCDILEITQADVCPLLQIIPD